MCWITLQRPSCCTLYLHCYQRLILNLHNLFTLWRALSNQTVPYQALTKIKKRATTKIEKVKVIQLLASSHPQKVVFPSPRPNWPLSLSLAINCQCLLHWTNHLAAKLNAVAKLNVFNPPGLLEEKKWSIWWSLVGHGITINYYFKREETMLELPGWLV